MWSIKIELKFYEKLFKSEGCDKDAGKKLLQNLNKKLDDLYKRDIIPEY
jgi:uncharacterized protein YlaN (UPF0358 family)